ncbi:MAG: nuclear transport factor 2 family protein [Gammaproteobacteria bacterium]|nr:nuclear transport factor 2 family protein [Gammaproteobacteria bacterium]
MTDLNELNARVKKLEDIEEIKRLKFQYCNLVDAGFLADELGALFTDDGVWEAGEPWGSFEGRKAIVEFFRTQQPAVSFSVHALSNPEIDVVGDTAHARWRTLVPATLNIEEDRVAHWMFCDYTDEYQKVDGRWLFSRVKADVTRVASYSDGWD